MMLQPRSLGDQIDAVFRLYRRRFKTLFFLAVLAILPQAVGMQIFGSLMRFGLNSPGGSPDFGPGTPFVFAPLFLFGGFIGFAWFLMAYLALVRHCLNLLLDRDETLNQTLGFSLRRLPGFFFVSFMLFLFAWVLLMGAFIPAMMAGMGGGPLAGMIGVFGTFLMMIVMMLLAVRILINYALFITAIAGEETRAWASLKRSRELMSHVDHSQGIASARWRLMVGFMIVTLLGAVINALAVIPQWIAMIALSAVAEPSPLFMMPVYVRLPLELLTYATSALAMPLFPLFLSIFYVDLRARREGFDLEAELDALAAERGEPVAPEMSAPKPSARPMSARAAAARPMSARSAKPMSARRKK